MNIFKHMPQNIHSNYQQVQVWHQFYGFHFHVIDWLTKWVATVIVNSDVNTILTSTFIAYYSCYSICFPLFYSSLGKPCFVKNCIFQIYFYPLLSLVAVWSHEHSAVVHIYQSCRTTQLPSFILFFVTVNVFEVRFM